VETRQGLAFVLSGGWQSLRLLDIPDERRLALLAIFEAGTLAVGHYTAHVAVADPTGAERARVSFPVSVEKTGDVLRIPRVVEIEVRFDQLGLWSASVHSDVTELATVDFVVKRD
jgi:hypothetical protein